MPTHFPVGLVSGVFASATHSFSKVEREFMLLVPGLRVEGDARSGTVVQHV